MVPDIELRQVLFIIELVGVAAFAIAGSLTAIERQMDVFGVLVLALITALGGGMIRDMLVGVFPMSLRTPVYFYTAAAGMLFSLPFNRVIQRNLFWLKVFDALGLAIFSVLGAQVALSRELNFLSVLLLGLLTGIGGGVLRDVLANEVPLVLRKEIYALASLVGISTLWLLIHLGVDTSVAVMTGAAVIFALRLAAIRWNLNLPRVRRH